MGIDKNKIKELIEEWGWVVNGSVNNINDPAFSNLINPDINDVELKVRDEIHDLNLNNIPEIQELDKKALRIALKYGGYYRKKPDIAKDKKRWWWHLDKIGELKYSANLLPDYLRDIYLNFKKNS